MEPGPPQRSVSTAAANDAVNLVAGLYAWDNHRVAHALSGGTARGHAVLLSVPVPPGPRDQLGERVTGPRVPVQVHWRDRLNPVERHHRVVVSSPYPGQRTAVVNQYAARRGRFGWTSGRRPSAIATARS